MATNTKQACGCFRAVGFCEFGGDLDKVLAEILNDAQWIGISAVWGQTVKMNAGMLQLT